MNLPQTENKIKSPDQPQSEDQDNLADFSQKENQSIQKEPLHSIISQKKSKKKLYC